MQTDSDSRATEDPFAAYEQAKKAEPKLKTNRSAFHWLIIAILTVLALAPLLLVGALRLLPVALEWFFTP